jgi:hypothetical protein
MIGGRVLRKATAAEAGSSGGELTGDLGVCPIELLGAQPDVSGERFRLSLARSTFCRGSAVSVDDRQVFSDSESRILRVFDGVEDAPLGRADVTGAVAGYPGGLLQLVSFAADDGYVGSSALPQRVATGTVPGDGLRLVAHR